MAKDHSGIDEYIGALVSVQFRGQIMLYQSAIRGDVLTLVNVVTKEGNQVVPVATQCLDNLKIVRVEENAYFFEMIAPGGAAAEFRVDKELVAFIWRPVRPPTSLLAV